MDTIAIADHYSRSNLSCHAMCRDLEVRQMFLCYLQPITASVVVNGHELFVE